MQLLHSSIALSTIVQLQQNPKYGSQGADGQRIKRRVEKHGIRNKHTHDFIC